MINVLKFTNNVPDTGSLLDGANVNSYNCSNSNNQISISPTTFSGAFDLKYSLNGTNFITLSGQTGYTILISSSYPTFILDESIYNFALNLAISYTTYCDSTKPCGEIFSANYNINKLSVTPTVNQPSSNLIYNRCLFFTNANQSQINQLNGFSYDTMQAMLSCEDDKIYLCYYQRFYKNFTFFQTNIFEKILIAQVQWRGVIGSVNSGTLTRFKISDSIDTGTISVTLNNATAASLKTTIKTAFQTNSGSQWTGLNSTDFTNFLNGFDVTLVNNQFRFSYNPFTHSKAASGGQMYEYSSPFYSWSDPDVLLGPPAYNSTNLSITPINSTSWFGGSPVNNTINLHFNNSSTASTSTYNSVSFSTSKLYSYLCAGSNILSAINFNLINIEVVSPRKFYLYYNNTKRAQSSLLPLNVIEDTGVNSTINNNVAQWNNYRNRFIDLSTLTTGAISNNITITCTAPRSVYFNMTGLVGSLANFNCQNIKYKKTGDPTWFYNGSIANSVNNPLPLNTTATSVDYEATAQCLNTTPICNKIQTISV